MQSFAHDIHASFQRADRSSDVDVLIRFLDAAASLESIRTCRERMLELSALREGQRVLDIGCGVGHSALDLARTVGRAGSVLGVDRSEPLLAEARLRAKGMPAPARFQVGDARELDLPAHAFDLCRTERVLMYVDEPERVLDEMFRVAAPGGRLVFYEFDYDGVVVDAPDLPLTRRIARLIADSVPSPWIGRQLPRLLRERGARVTALIPHMILTPFAMFRFVVDGTIAQAVRDGGVEAADVDPWWRALERADAGGNFLAGFPGFIVCAQVP